MAAAVCGGAMLCPRKPHWPTLLVILGASWIVATFLTAAGIYVVIFHVHAQQAQMFDRSDQLRTVSALFACYQRQDRKRLDREVYFF